MRDKPKTMKRLEFSKPVYGEIYALALPHLMTRRNDVHTRICYGFALRLLKREGGDPDIVVPGVLLHDVGWIKVPEELQPLAFGPKMTRPDLRDLHEREGAAMAAAILAGVGYPQALSERIRLIILRHDSGRTAETVEEALVKDSDKLYRFSRNGFYMDVEYFSARHGAHLDFLEERLDRWFLTPTGRRLARVELRARRREVEKDGL